MSLARGAARGAMWNFGTVLVERGIGFVVLAALLRLVPVRDFGLVAIGGALSDLARAVISGGAGELVQAAPEDRESVAAAFWCQMLAAGGFAVLLAAAAPGLAAIYRLPKLAPVLWAFAFTLVLAAFVTVPSALLAARFRYRALGVMSLGSTILGGAAAVPFALGGGGVEALVVQRAVGVLFYALAAAAVAGWRPPGFPGTAAMRRAGRFTWPLMQAAVVDYFSTTGFVVLVGLVLSPVDTGRFRIAQRLAEIVEDLAIMPARKVFLSVFVALGDVPARRFAAALRLVDVLFVVLFGAAAVASAVARPLIAVLFGPAWLGAAPVFAALVLVAPASVLYGLLNPVLTAIGRTRTVFRYAWVNAVSIGVVAVLGARLGVWPLACLLAARGLLAALVLLPGLAARSAARSGRWRAWLWRRCSGFAPGVGLPRWEWGAGDLRMLRWGLGRRCCWARCSPAADTPRCWGFLRGND